MAWPGEKQRHAASARGITTTRPQVVDNNVVWFTSRGMLTEMVSLLNMVGFGELFGNDKLGAKGYPQGEYEADAKMVALLPADKAADSVDWLNHEWSQVECPKRRAQLLKLAQTARNKISLELQKPNPAHTQSHLRQSRKYYNDFIINTGGT